MIRTAFLFVLAAGFGAAGSVAQDEPPRFMFAPDLDKEVYYRQPDHRLLRGRLAITGVFIPDRYNPLVMPPLRGDEWYVGVNDPNRNPRLRPRDQTEEVYEFRAGALIRGMLRYPGVFIPIPGERVIWVDDYEPGGRTPRIYNIPGAIVRVPPGKTRKRFPGVPDYLPQSDWTRDGLVPDFKSVPKSTHTFQADRDRIIGLFREKTVYAGRLMSGGDFVPLPDIRPVPYRRQPTAVVRLADGKEATIPVINHVGDEEADEHVYEVRGWVLLSGRLTSDGRFTAWENTPTVNWSDYFESRLHAKPGSRIYNLPGTIVPIDGP